MIYRPTAALAVLANLIWLTQLAQADAVLTNPGFEDGLASWTVHVYGAQSQCDLESEQGYHNCPQTPGPGSPRLRHQPQHKGPRHHSAHRMHSAQPQQPRRPN